MTVTVLGHVPFEGPASIATWAYGRGHRVEQIRLWAADALPDPNGIDLLVIMGGPMSVWHSDAFPWLRDEERFVRAALANGVPTLGVCLGAQMIARALDAPVYPGRQREIGYAPIEVDAKAFVEFFRPRTAGMTRLTPLHWHGDTFDLPAGSIRFAGTLITPNQAFVKPLASDSLAVGLQFHLEANESSIRSLVSACAHEIGGGPYEMSAAHPME
ncbi:MAG: glutamine amidotransferase-related protein, partial [Spirochaetota bacterium]